MHMTTQNTPPKQHTAANGYHQGIGMWNQGNLAVQQSLTTLFDDFTMILFEEMAQFAPSNDE